MTEFQPTYLYIKQHSITKKCYFGKTTRNPEEYTGSGTRWLNHIRKHGREYVDTLWFKLFDDKEELTKIATLFSVQQDIVKSDVWLNLKIENGLDGGRDPGIHFSEEHRRKLSEAAKKNKLGTKQSLETIQKRADKNRGKKRSPESLANMRGRTLEKVTCVHCHKIGGKNLMARYHFDNCKYK